MIHLSCVCFFGFAFILALDVSELDGVQVPPAEWQSPPSEFHPELASSNEAHAFSLNVLISPFATYTTAHCGVGLY